VGGDDADSGESSVEVVTSKARKRRRPSVKAVDKVAWPRVRLPLADDDASAAADDADDDVRGDGDASGGEDNSSGDDGDDVGASDGDTAVVPDKKSGKKAVMSKCVCERPVSEGASRIVSCDDCHAHFHARCVGLEESAVRVSRLAAVVVWVGWN
jgi:hypothetical protein